MSDQGAAKFQFNNFQEIKSHSSILYNERMAILFYLLDMKNLLMHKTKYLDAIYDVHATLRQIYKNIRMLVRFNDTMRVSMNIETKDRGIYIPDVTMATIQRMLRYCENNGYTEKRINILIDEIDNAEMLLKDILQYFSYFIRPDFSQKPDVDMATEKYKSMADKRTVEELKELVGKRSKINFEELGSERIEPESKEIDYDPAIDGQISEYMDESEDIDMEDEDDE